MELQQIDIFGSITEKDPLLDGLRPLTARVFYFMKSITAVEQKGLKNG